MIMDKTVVLTYSRNVRTERHIRSTGSLAEAASALRLKHIMWPPPANSRCVGLAPVLRWAAAQTHIYLDGPEAPVALS
jgi:hypothetical protein